MNAVAKPHPAPARLALLGTGTVGSAFLELLHRRRTAPGVVLELVAEANTRRCLLHRSVSGDGAVSGGHAIRAVQALGTGGTRIVVDATACDALAQRHAEWLADGIHVVTACKLGQGAMLDRWRAIAAARALAGSHYGDSATVGAGLPLLRSVRELRGAGERIHAVAGVLSGSLAWLLARHDGSRPFGDWVEEAARRGYTEPDPRDDLSGEDVRRKLLILARTAGHPLEHDAVQVEPIDPCTMDARLRAGRADGRRLAFVARLRCDPHGPAGARAGLEAIDAGDVLAQGDGTDNRVAIWCDRYPERPLVIQGPGAGAHVTAAALLDDVLRICSSTGSRVP